MRGHLGRNGEACRYTIIEVNPALQSMLGMGSGLTGKRLSDTGLASAAWLELCEGVLHDGPAVSFDFHNQATGLWHEIRVNRAGPDQIAQFFFDITARKVAEAELLASQGYLRLILDAAADAFYCVDRDGVTTHCNAAFRKMLGFQSDSDVIGLRLHDVIHHSHPDGSPYKKLDCPIYQAAQTGESRHVDNEVFFRIDGSSFPVEYWVRPIVRDGEHQGAICTFLDVTERRAAEETNNLLLREMNHRVKNLLSVMNGIVAISARGAGSAKEVTDAIRRRIEAVGRAHELILPRGLRADSERAPRTDLETLSTAVLSAFADRAQSGGVRRIEMAGPPVEIGESAATALALVLNELATNALKYGALSGKSGTARVAWSVTGDDLRLSWEESGGPPLKGPPAAEGFGSLLARRSVVGQLQGTLTQDWRPGGLAVEMIVPLQPTGGL